MAKVGFDSIFQSTAANQQEESQSFSGSLLSGATNIYFTSQDPNAVTYSGNNVPGNLTYTLNGTTFTVPGIVSRLFKSGSVYEGFYFISSGNDYALGSQETATAFILVWPGKTAAFPDQNTTLAGVNGTYSTSSDPVDSALNSLLTAQPKLISITEADADDKITTGGTVTYTFSFGGDIDAATFTAADIINVGTAGITIGAITEVSPGVFQVVVTGTSAGTIQLAIPAGSDIRSPTNFAVDTAAQITDDSVIQVSAATAGPVTVSSPTVNEGSPYAVFTVTGTAGQAISLALATGTASAADFGSTSFEVSLNGGATWSTYSSAVTLTGTTALVRTTITNDAISDNNETFTLTATPTGGTAATGTATIKDDGTGTIYNPDGTENTTAAKNNDAGLGVSSPTVNEGSPYAVFTVSGTVGQTLSLALATGTAGAADFGSTSFEVSLNGGATWTPYSSAVTLTGTTALVRTTIANDTIADNNETFTLTATPSTGTAATGTATIKDDGTGTIFNADGTENTTAVKNDDRPVSVTSPTVNEASPYAMFTVTGTAGQKLALALATGTAGAADFGSTSFDVSLDGGATWTPYSAAITLSGTTALVRTTITNDNIADNNENFTLTATPTGGVAATGTATIKDDGTGTIYNPDGTENTTAAKDNDGGLGISAPTVNEGSPYAVFTINGTQGQKLDLALTTGTAGAADFGSTSFDVSLDGGKTWTPYTAAITLTGATALVRTTVANDAISDNNEVFTLTATPSTGTAVTGTATIKDDGTGTIFNADGTENTTAVKNDDRPVTVTGPTVNEGSPYAVFTVSGTAGQALDLALATGTAGSADFGSTSFDVSLDGGATWVPYTAAVTLTGATALVRTTIANDSIADNNETFTLTATALGGNPGVGTATIKDDGTGAIFSADGTEDTTAVKNDDRPVTISAPKVNEGSPYGVFTLTGAPGQTITLGLNSGTATTADYGPSFDVSLDGGKTWAPYSAAITLTGATALIRTPIANDTVVDNNETFSLTAAPRGGPLATGTATILDNGTGAIFNPDGTENAAAPKNDDAIKPVYSVLLANGDRYYTKDATDAAKMALGLNNIFEGARFDNMSAAQGGVHRDAYYQAITKDWYFTTSQSLTPYACYTLQPPKSGFEVANPGTAGATEFRMYLNANGITQIVSAAEATALGLTSKGYVDKGAVFAATTQSAFTFDAEAYLVTNSMDATIQSFVKSLAATYKSTSSKEFIEAVEQHYLVFGVANGLLPGASATAADLNTAFATNFIA